MHDAACGQDVLPMAQREDWTLLSAADRGRVGICGPRGDEDGLFVWRRPRGVGRYGWDFDNSEDAYHKVGLKKPNPWGLHDMHGNVAEWTLDQYIPDFYQLFAGKVAKEPWAIPKKLYPQAVRGGSWDDEPAALRSAARRGSDKDWKQQDPQLPQSIWYFTDALFVGFRVVRPLHVPTAEERAKTWDAGAN